MIPEQVECISMPNRKRVMASTKEMVFRPCVYALIVHEGKILLPKLPWDEPKPYWLPGGGIEAGESTEDNLKRELIEEAGMEITVDALAAVHDQFVYWENKRKAAHYIMLLYHCTALSTEIQPPDADLDDIEMMEWVSIEEVKAGDFYYESLGRVVLDAIKNYHGLPPTQ